MDVPIYYSRVISGVRRGLDSPLFKSRRWCREWRTSGSRNSIFRPT